MVLFEQFVQCNNALCYRNKEILVGMNKLSGMNATTEEYETAFGIVNATSQSHGLQNCSLEEQLDQVRLCFVLLG
jgi:hypothetical protein